MRALSVADLERFWGKVRKTRGCWLWTATPLSSGYGQFGWGPGCARVRRGAHVVSFILAGGKLPDGLCVCHTCDVRHCVRPDHLFLGTDADNLADMTAKGRRVGNVKLRPAQVYAIRRARDRRTATLAALAKKYGVSEGCIMMIGTRRNWKHLPEKAA